MNGTSKEQVLGIVLEHPAGINQTDIAKKVGVGPSWVHHRCLELAVEGLVEIKVQEKPRRVVVFPKNQGA